jgi:DNA-binding beta-propeller fold protein YncE
VTADSNRFSLAGRKSEWLSVIDPVNFKVIGNVAAGLFPRELYVTADGKTLLVTNFASDSIELVDLAGLTPAYFAQQRPIKVADDTEQAKLRAALDARIASNQPSTHFPWNMSRNSSSGRYEEQEKSAFRGRIPQRCSKADVSPN